MQDDFHIFGNGKSSKTTKKNQHHKFPSGLGYPKPERKDEGKSYTLFLDITILDLIFLFHHKYKNFGAYTRFGDSIVGAVSDNFDERIKQKIFHAEIVVDVAKVSAETKAYEPIPIIAEFTNKDGSDNLTETIEANYKRVRQEVLSLVDSEIERIKAAPLLCHLIKA